MKELWVDICGFEGLYQISNQGRVFSVKKKIFIDDIREKLTYWVDFIPNKVKSVKLSILKDRKFGAEFGLVEEEVLQVWRKNKKMDFKELES